MEDHYESSWGSGSTMAITFVAIILVLGPLFMGNLQKPSSFLIILFLLSLFAIAFFLYQSFSDPLD